MTDGVILGIDGGGSKTLIALADRAGRIIRVARGEPINPLDSSGWRRALETQARPSPTRLVCSALPPRCRPMAKSKKFPQYTDALVKYRRGGQLVAVASIHRDQESLRAELDLEARSRP
jgi:hypothetical protein